MKDVLLNIIGEYSANADASGVGQLDMPWLVAGVLFITLIAVTAWFACRVIVGVLHD